MKITYTLFAIAIAAIGFTTNAKAQTSAESTLGVTAQLIKPIGINATASMNFGILTTSTAESSITWTSTGDGAAFTPTAAGTTSFQSTPTAAAFSVSGEGNYGFTITLPANTALTATDGSPGVTLTDFAHNIGASPVLDAAGTETFEVTAKLTIPAGAISGVYTVGSLPVTVAYN